jgi:hypothetical protein
MRLGSLSQKCFESKIKYGKCDKKDAAARLVVRAEGFPDWGKAFAPAKIQLRTKVSTKESADWNQKRDCCAVQQPLRVTL